MYVLQNSALLIKAMNLQNNFYRSIIIILKIVKYTKGTEKYIRIFVIKFLSP